MVEEQLATEKLALFFYFSFMDEGRAEAATKKCIKKIRRRTERENPRMWEPLLVQETRRALSEKSTLGTLSRVGFVQGHVKFPRGSNWGPWFEFRKSADPDIFSTLIWAKILGLSVESIAQGLGVTTGTVNFRLAMGLKELGKCVPREAKSL